MLTKDDNRHARQTPRNLTDALAESYNGALNIDDFSRICVVSLLSLRQPDGAGTGDTTRS